MTDTSDLTSSSSGSDSDSVSQFQMRLLALENARKKCFYNTIAPVVCARSTATRTWSSITSSRKGVGSTPSNLGRFPRL